MQQILLLICENYVREVKREEGDHLIDEGWKDIGFDLYYEYTWKNSDRTPFVTIQDFIDQCR